MNFRVLRNIHAFYRELMNEVKEDLKKQSNAGNKAPLPARALCYCILYMEGFMGGTEYGQDARDLAQTIMQDIHDAMKHIDYHEWTELKVKIQEIKKPEEAVCVMASGLNNSEILASQFSASIC